MKLPGAPRKVTDEQVKRLLEWRPFSELCNEIGVKQSTGRHVRFTYRKGLGYKRPSP